MIFLHCSDLHLGKKPSFGSEIFKNKRFEDYFSAFDRIIEQAKENNAEAILVAGDFFDKRETHPNILSKTEELLQKCKNYEIKVVVIDGNHDLIYKNKEHESWIVYLENKGLLQRPFVEFMEDNERKYHSVFIGKTEIFGLGYPGASVDDALLEFSDYCKEREIKNCVVLVHTAIGGSDLIGGFLKDKTVLEKMRGYAIYIGGGHGHRLDTYPKEDPLFFVPGSPEYCDFGEDPALKNAIIFNTDSKEYKIIKQNPRSCIKESIIVNSETPEQFREEFHRFLSLIDISDEDIAIVEISSIANSFIPDLKWAEKEILNRGALFAKVEWDRRRSNFGSAHSKNSVEEIEFEQIKKWEHWGKAAEAATKALTEMKKAKKDGRIHDVGSIFEETLNLVIRGKNENN
jgi:DNA repair exonuclease SbcCD nuclease subunit